MDGFGFANSSACWESLGTSAFAPLLLREQLEALRVGVLMPLTGQGIKLLHNSALYALNYCYPRLH